MPALIFTSHLDGVAPQGELEFEGDSVGAVLESAFAAHDGLRHYILDDQGRLRKHVIIFADSRKLNPGTALQQPVTAQSEIYVLQALSGGTADISGELE